MGSPIINQIQDLFKKYHIKSVLDAPCRNFDWISQLDLTGIHYVGIDIDRQLIEQNTLNHNIAFSCSDLLNDWLPRVDLIVCRDYLLSLPFASIKHLITRFKWSESDYLLTSNLEECADNVDMVGWRRINLELPPFNFPSPLESISEQSTYVNELDKTLCLWRLEDL